MVSRRRRGSSSLPLPFPRLPFFSPPPSSSPPSPPFIPPSRHPGASLARPLLSTLTIAMSAYPRMDPYRGSRYEHGIDAKVVVMGNSGQSVFRLFPSIHSLLSSVPYNKAWARPAYYNDIRKTNTTPRTPHPLPVLFSSQRKLP